MSHLKDLSDDRNKTWCIHCTRPLYEVKVTRDHVPSKSLLLTPLPPNLPVVNICSECNNSFSLDEEYFMAFLHVVLAGSVEGPFKYNPKIASILEKNPSLKARIKKAKIEFETLGGKKKIFWKPDANRISNIVVKNARGHAYYEYGEPMLEDPAITNITPLESMTEKERHDFEDASSLLWPEVGSRMFNRLAIANGEPFLDNWIVVQDGVYRYTVFQGNGLTIRSVLYEYLATEVRWQ